MSTVQLITSQTQKNVVEWSCKRNLAKKRHVSLENCRKSLFSQETKETVLRIQSTDTFQRSCKSPSTALKEDLRGRNSDISFSRQLKSDTFEGSRIPEPSLAKPKSTTKDKFKVFGALALGFTSLGVGVLAKR